MRCLWIGSDDLIQLVLNFQWLEESTAVVDFDFEVAAFVQHCNVVGCLVVDDFVAIDAGHAGCVEKAEKR